jgi:hypothetical protein
MLIALRGELLIRSIVLALALGPVLTLFAKEGAFAHETVEHDLAHTVELSGDFNQLQELLLSRNLCAQPATGAEENGLGTEACNLAREPAPTPSQSVLPQAVRESRQQDLVAFCSNPRVQRIADRFREGVSLDRSLSRAAQREFAEEEAIALRDIVDEPYFSMAVQNFFRSNGPHSSKVLTESICRSSRYDGNTGVIHEPVTRDSSVIADAIRRRCPDQPFLTPCDLLETACFLAGRVTTSSNHSCYMISRDTAARERCVEQARLHDEAEQKRIAEENRQALAACETARTERVRRCETDTAARRAEEVSRFEACATEVRTEFQQRAEAERLREQEAQLLREEEDYAKCRARDIEARERALCAISGEPKSPDLLLGEALRRNGRCSGGQTESQKSLQTQATTLRAQVGAMRSAYDHVFPEPKLEACLTRFGRDARGVCSALERARNQTQPQLQEIYTPARLAQANERLNELKTHFRSFLQSQRSLSATDRSRLLARLDQVVIGAPASAEALAQVIRNGATFNCGFEEVRTIPSKTAPRPERECSSSFISLPPDMLMKLTSGSDIDSGPVESILFHEMGHALALSGDTPLFSKLNSCLSRNTQASGFPEKTLPTLQKEALADWFGAQALGVQLRASPSSIRTEMLENRIGGEVCGLMHSETGSCVNDGATYYYPKELLAKPAMNEACRETLENYDHPLTSDRLQLLLSNGGVKNSLGCSMASLQETRGCSL